MESPLSKRHRLLQISMVSLGAVFACGVNDRSVSVRSGTGGDAFAGGAGSAGTGNLAAGGHDGRGGSLPGMTTGGVGSGGPPSSAGAGGEPGAGGSTPAAGGATGVSGSPGAGGMGEGGALGAGGTASGGIGSGGTGTGGKTSSGGASAGGGMMAAGGKGAGGAGGGSGGRASGGSGGTAGSSSGGTAGSGGGGPLGDVNALRAACVTAINQYRASLNPAPSALSRASASVETCSDSGAASDAASGVAHGSAGKCPGMSAQDTCPGWSVGSTGAVGALNMCLAQMWAEGPPPEGRDACIQKYFMGDTACFLAHGHFLNMSDPANTVVSCGFAVMSNGKLWMNQDFGH